MDMHILILGGDGYLGWPSAMRFSRLGWKVTIVDNYLRRRLCAEHGLEFLYPVPHMPERVRLWQELSGHAVTAVEADLAEPETLRALFAEKTYESLCQAPWPGLPQAVLHYAEQPSAPFSVLNYRTTDLTIVNNLRVTDNLLCAVRDLSPGSHIVHIGTMGEYGTPNIDIEEGWLEILHKGRKDTFLFPRQGPSVYHTTKIMDTDLMWFFTRAYKLRITDLMQGPVYGMETEESRLAPGLRPFFNYDEYFGTVINRFIVQAAIGYPLTIYGKGGQTRGYININDTMQCVEKAVTHPARPGELRIFNQITETFSVLELAQRVRKAGRALGLDVQVEHVINPRFEAEEHYYNPAHRALEELGVRPHPLDGDVLKEMLKIADACKGNVNKRIIFNA